MLPLGGALERTTSSKIYDFWGKPLIFLKNSKIRVNLSTTGSQTARP
jgi:hypothetical protein